MKVLIGCEFSGIVREAFKTRGHDAWSCDFEDTEIPGQHIKADLFTIIDSDWDLMIAHPDCTNLTVSANRWFNGKEGAERFMAQQRDIKNFLKLFCCKIPKICLENPATNVINTYLMPPTQVIHPYNFGHGETKKTGLWLKGLPFLKNEEEVSGREAKIHNEPPGKDRKKNRSRTYTGIAAAMAKQWG